MLRISLLATILVMVRCCMQLSPLAKVVAHRVEMVVGNSNNVVVMFVGNGSVVKDAINSVVDRSLLAARSVMVLGTQLCHVFVAIREAWVFRVIWLSMMILALLH